MRFWPRHIHHVWVFWLAISIHISWGILLISYNSPLQATAVSTLADVIPQRQVLGAVLIVISIMALASMLYDDFRPMRFGLLIAPQQCALFVSAIGSIYLVWLKHYSAVDIKRLGLNHSQVVTLLPLLHRFSDWRLLLTSQIPTIMVAVCHMGAIVQRYWEGPWRTE